MRQISFISANYVGRALGYPGGTVSEWGKFDAATRDASPEIHFPAIARDVADAGFANLDLWTAHCHWEGHGPQAADDVTRACDRFGLSITSYIGGFAVQNERDLEAVFSQMNRLGAPIFSGMIWGLPDEQLLPIVDDVADRFGVRWAHENHPERSADLILDRIARGRHRNCGVCLDTGWCGTQGLDALEAVKAMRDHLFIVHLKDVEAAGAHDTCALGEGIVPVERVARYLVQSEWSGTIGIEHEPFDRDPMPEVRTSLARLRAWLG